MQCLGHCSHAPMTSQMRDLISLVTDVTSAVDHEVLVLLKESLDVTVASDEALMGMLDAEECTEMLDDLSANRSDDTSLRKSLSVSDSRMSLLITVSWSRSTPYMSFAWSNADRCELWQCKKA